MQIFPNLGLLCSLSVSSPHMESTTHMSTDCTHCSIRCAAVAVASRLRAFNKYTQHAIVRPSPLGQLLHLVRNPFARALRIDGSDWLRC